MKNISILAILLSLPFQILSQSKTAQFFTDRMHYDLAIVTEPFSLAVGAIHKASLKVWNTKHVECLFGIAYQHHHTFKSPYESSITATTTNNDIGFYLTNDWKFYPFKKKTFFAGIGLFWGVTESVSEGSLEIPAYNVSEKFYKKHTYMNYGSMQTFGWSFSERIQVSLYSMISLNGILDSGRARPAEVDSRFLVGINLGFAI